MGLVVSLILIAVGAILVWGVKPNQPISTSMPSA